MIRTVLLAILAVIVLAAATVQDITTSGDFIPEGSRIIAFLQSAGGLVIGLGLIAGLYTIPESNRNITSFLKAFVVLGLLIVLGRCEQWTDKLYGPDKLLTDESSGLSATVPSSWFIWTKKPDNVNFMVMDWAGSRSVSIVIMEPTSGSITEVDVTQAYQAIEEKLVGAYGAKTGSCDCGENCVGGIFNTTYDGKPLQLCMGVKHTGGYWILMTGGAVKSIEDGFAETQKVMASVQYVPKEGNTRIMPANEAARLFSAAANNQVDLLKELVSNGEDINQKDQDGNTALMYSFKYEEETLYELLAMGADVNAVGAKGQTPLTAAAAANNAIACQILLDKGANVNAQEVDGHTALAYASFNRNLALAQQLVDAGADVNHRIGDRSLLQIATTDSNYDMIVFLTQNGAKP